MATYVVAFFIGFAASLAANAVSEWLKRDKQK